MSFPKLASWLFVSLVVMTLSGCNSAGSPSGSESSSDSPRSASAFYDSPVGQQIRLQQMHSRITRSLIPF